MSVVWLLPVCGDHDGVFAAGGDAGHVVSLFFPWAWKGEVDEPATPDQRTYRQRNPICPEDTCGHTHCTMWWMTIALKYPGHDGRDHGNNPLCLTCRAIEARRCGVMTRTDVEGKADG